MINCTYVDGIASSQAIDTAGEIVDLRGLDISSLIGAALNWEHFKDVPAQIVGKILEAKKIFSAEDCENERHLKYWNRLQLPFLYIKGRLFDDKKPSAVEAAALFKDDAEHPNEHPMVGFSIEGARLGEKQGMVVPRSIARKVTITNTNANKTCAAEMVPEKKEPKDQFDSLFKGEMELFTFGTPMEKSDRWISKLHSTGINHLHSTHGTVGIKKIPIGPGHQFEVRHNDKLVGTSPDVKNASQAAKKYMFSLGKADLNKAMEAGSGNAAPSQLVQGAALGKESLEGSMQKMHKKERSKGYADADNAYSTWDKREEFRSYMKKRMPHLADGEVDAIGRVLAFKQASDKKKKIGNMYAATAIATPANAGPSGSGTPAQ